LAYLRAISQLAPTPAIVNLLDQESDRQLIWDWIGKSIDSVNTQLSHYLQLCHNCFHPPEQRPVQIFAVPLVHIYGVDGLCNFQTQPVTILIDVGRVAPSDWLKLVVHEYAHAHAGYPGHHQAFVKVLAHLCLGLGLEPPQSQASLGESLRHWPYCEPTIDPLTFWRGKH
jgi:hypothetical protein